MRTHVALLRGINVGGRNKVAMKDLRQLLTGLGFDEVDTYIQSGNAVFSAGSGAAGSGAELAPLIEDAIASQLGVTCAVIALSRSELEEAISANPFSEPDDPRFLHVVFRSTDLTPADRESVEAALVKARAKAPASRDDVRIVGRNVYVSTPDGFGRSELAAQLSRQVMARGTARNWATVRQLDAMLGD